MLDLICNNWVNAMAADGLAPCIARSLAAVIFTAEYTFPWAGFQYLRHLSVDMLENTLMFS